MEVKQVSENRKRPSSPILHTTIGIIAQSNGSVSGGVPLDSNGGKNPDEKLQRPDSPRKRPRSRFSDPAASGSYVLLRTLTKDLRSRRVFSPNSELSRAIIDQKLGSEFGFDESVDDVKAIKIEGPESVFSFQNRRIDGKKATEGEQNGNVDLGFRSEARSLDNGSGNLKTIDVTMAADFGVGGKCGDGMESLMGEKASNGKAQIEGSVGEVFVAVGDKNTGSNSKSKLLLRPCSQRKVFKTPGSVSYRRLLPYLMDISKKNSCELEIDDHPKLDKGSEEKKFQATPASQSEEDSKDNAGKNGVSVECQNNHSDTMHKTVLDGPSESFNGRKLILSTSDNVTVSSLSGVDESCSKLLLNGHVQNFGVGLSCKDQKLTNLDCHMANVVEDLHVVKDNVIDSKLSDNIGTGESDSGIPLKVDDGYMGNTNLSATSDDSNLGKDDELCQYTEDSKLPGFEGMKALNIVHPCKYQKVNQMDDQRGRDDGEVLNKVNDLNEESIQMTPPDAEIFGKPEVEGNGVDREGCVLQNKDFCLGKLSNGINHRNGSLDYNTRHNSNSKCKAVLKPRSQLKLFRNPGSFSYRRLLPFLKDIAKDSSDASVNGHCTKPEKDSDPPSSLFASDNQEIPLDKSNGFGLEENQKDDSSTPPLALPTAVNDSMKDKLKIVSPEHVIEFQTSQNSEKEETLQVNKVISDILSELQTSPDLLSTVQDTGRPVASFCPSNCESSSNEELVMSNSNQSSVEIEGDSPKLDMESSDVVKPVEADRPSSQQKFLVTSEIPAVGLKKGILKRNPRGCRGLCTCLNCASFRLHAVRAFEFSRNQMEDAEEMVLELIKELSYMRNVLAKSANGADDEFVVQVNQAKEACRKASEVEELAKTRLNQMNYDLDIHCRITCLEPPRVRFANRVEEHINSKANFQSDQVLNHQKEDGQRELHTR